MIRHKLLAALCFFSFCAGIKTQAQAIYFNSFKTNAAAGIILGGDAKLTSGIEDPPNEGYLRLTPNVGNKKGFAYIDTPFPSSQGIKVEFEFYSWGGNMADGITFFLFDPKDGFDPGQYGGALGYAQNKNDGTGPGMLNGFLAVGLDEYGNFGPATETKNGGFKNKNGQVYTSVINANGLIAVRGGVGPNGEREGPTAYPFLGGKITDDVFGGTEEPLASDLLALADQFILSTNGRGPNETDPNFRKVRLDIKKITGTGFLINVDVFSGDKGRWIKVLTDFVYNIADAKIPTTFKAGFSASTGGQTNNHEIRNVLITPASVVLSTPVATADATNTLPNQSALVTVLANDNPIINGGTYQSGSLDLDPSTAAIETTKTVAGKGTITVDNAGVVTFTPVNGFLGLVTVDYNFKDSFGIKSNNATLSINVSNVNAVPTVAAITKLGTEDTAIPFTGADFSSKFTDPDNDVLNKIKVISLPANGTLSLNGIAITAGQEIPAGQLATISFTPAANWNGNTSFNWNGNDGNSYAALDAAVNISIAAINDLPTVSPISKSGTEDNPITFSALDFTSKFSDPESEPLSKIKVINLPANGILKLSGATITTGQEIPESQLANITFTPAADWNGSTTFSWNGNDGTAYAVIDALVNISITAVNDLPTVSPITKSGIEDILVTFTALDFSSKFSDPENDALSKIKIISLPPNGTLRLNGVAITIGQEISSGQFATITFTPGADWNGNTSFNWNGNDGNSYAASDAAVNITITGANDLPTVAAINKSGTEDTPVSFTANDFSSKFNDPDNDALAKVKIISLPANGTLKLNGVDILVNQEISAAQLAGITFSPSSNWYGNTSFNWNGYDGSSYAIADATVNITITSVNDLPTVSTITKSGTEDTPVAFTAVDFTSKFTDPENDALTKIKIMSLPANGSLKLNGTDITLNQEIQSAQLDNIVFIPALNWNGNTSFTGNGNDGTTYASNAAAVNITITSIIDPPTAVNDTQETDLNKLVEITVLINDFADGLSLDAASLVIINQPLHGDVQVINGVITYKPHDKYIGPDSFTYKVQDANGVWSNSAMVNINVKGFIMTNIFTPNGDGKNDKFEIVGLGNYDTADLTIFNRWGNEVYRNSNYINDWEGSGLNAGTYYFIIKLKKGSTTDIRKGWVLLKR